MIGGRSPPPLPPRYKGGKLRNGTRKDPPLRRRCSTPAWFGRARDRTTGALFKLRDELSVQAQAREARQLVAEQEFEQARGPLDVDQSQAEFGRSLVLTAEVMFAAHGSSRDSRRRARSNLELSISKDRRQSHYSVPTRQETTRRNGSCGGFSLLVAARSGSRRGSGEVLPRDISAWPGGDCHR